MKRLKEPTEICKICFKEYHRNSLRTLVHNDHICNGCYKKLNPVFIKHNVDGVKALSIYYYDEDIKTFLYQLKGCYDIEISSIFLANFSFLLRIRYFNYVVVPIPSYHIEDVLREFNHVEEIFRCLKLPMLKIVYKTEKYKQSDQKAKDRHLILNYLKVSDLESVHNKRVLIVDDVITTGSTLKATINLIKEGRPKKIRILTMAMTKEH